MTNIVELMARSDAAFDGRDWSGMGRIDRARYIRRAGFAFEAAAPLIRAQALEEAAKRIGSAAEKLEWER